MKFVISLILAIGIAGCASSVLKHDDADKILANKEYENILHVKEIPPSGEYVHLPGPEPVTTTETTTTTTVKTVTTTPIGKGHAKKGLQKKMEGAVVGRRQPELEDVAGFAGRRPVKDPFRVGEKTTLELSYFAVIAGDLTMEVKPFVEVNERKAYHFKAEASSTSVFAMFYAVDDWAETFLDYERMTPFNYSLSVKESKQLRETRSYFDWDKMKGFFWDKRITQEHGVEEKKIEWNILDYSQNIFSAPFYLRTFQLEPGKKVAYRVGHEGKNIVVTGEVLRREKLDTKLGPMNTVVVRPTFEIDGEFKPVGEIYFWMTDDDRKFFVRIESKIKIGKIVGEIKALDKGREP